MPDQTAATAAGVYNYLLSGTHYTPADALRGDQVLKTDPYAGIACRTNRDFLGRAIRHLAAQGVTQFLDVGTGLPADQNVHQVARSLLPHPRVLYVDNDPAVVQEASRLVDGVPGVHVIQADVRDTRAVLAAAGQHLDLTRPVAVMLVAVMHFVVDDEAAYRAVNVYRDAVSAGSHLVVSHGTADARPAESAASFLTIYDMAGIQICGRTRPQVEGFFTGWDLLAPGVVWVSEWHNTGQMVPPRMASFYAGVGRKP